MSELISGKGALIALANGKEVENWNGSIWWDVEGTWQLDVFLKTDRKFRLKPRTISINGIEVPAPFEPKEGDEYYHISIQTVLGYGWDKWQSSDYDARASMFGVWRTEEEIKQVVAALRSIFNEKTKEGNTH